MFDLDPGKLIVIGIVALIAIPSKDLPRVLRALGQMVGKMRRMSAEFQGQFMEAMREMEVDDLKKEIEETNNAIMRATKIDHAFDPMTEARKQITNAIEGETDREPSGARGDHKAVERAPDDARSNNGPPPEAAP